MKIACRQANICIKSNNPNFKYKFAEADVPLEVDDAHTEKILMNSDFYESDKDVKSVPEKQVQSVPKKTWSDELQEINGIGEKTAKDIQIVFPKKSDLLEALEKGGDLPFDDNIEKLLQEVFIH